MLTKELQKMYDEAVGVKSKILNDLKPFRKKEAELQGNLDKIVSELRIVREEIVSIEQPGLAEASMTIKALRKSAGGKGLEAESGKFGIKQQHDVNR